VLQCVVVCCRVLQYFAVSCSAPAWGHVLQCVAVCCSALQCVTECCQEGRESPFLVLDTKYLCALQRVAVRCSLLLTRVRKSFSRTRLTYLCAFERVVVRCVLQCVAVCCSALQRVAVRCSALQCVAVCCSALPTKARKSFFCTRPFGAV